MSLSATTEGAPRLAVVGGGLAGLAAAVAARREGLAVDLFESRRRLGGRAGSFRDPDCDVLVDHCQHVAMGCCTNLADFCRRTGIADCFRRHRRLHFFGPDGRQHDFAGVPWLPPPLHLLPGLLRLGYLSLGQRLRIGRTMLRLARWRPPGGPTHSADETIGDWLRRQGESPQAIERFWSVVLVSALGETLDRASIAAAQKVFVDGFLANRRAYEVEIPDVPLSEIYDRRLADWLAQSGVRVHLGCRVRVIEGDAARAEAVLLADDSRVPADFVVAAVPWRTAAELFPAAMRATLPGLESAAEIPAAPITAVHLWFDRPIMPLEHAVLVSRLSQWVFHHRWEQGDSPQRTFYYQVVISGSHELAGRDRQQVVTEVCQELRAIWPQAREAELVRWRMVTDPLAVFSVRPGLDAIRPPQQTAIPNLFLSGDWTATDWPATMEGAVRSGYLAVEGILGSLGRPRAVLVPDLPRSALVRWFVG